MLRRVLVIAISLILLLGLTVPVGAQTSPPQQVQDALDALNAALGTSLFFGSPNLFWGWDQQNFPDTSLGCPQAGVDYAQAQTNGFIVSLTYNGMLYDYRVSTDRTIIFRCISGQPEAAVTATPVPTATSAPPPTTGAAQPTGSTAVGSVVCAGNLPTRLNVGMQARSVGVGAINVRSYPNLTDANSVTGQLLPEGEFTITDGPQCATNRTWWQIDYPSAGGQVIGWVVEGDSNEYWLEPVGGGQPLQVAQPTAQPTATTQPTTITTTGTAISLANVAQVQWTGSNPLPDVVDTVDFLPEPSQDALVLTDTGALAYYSGVSVGRINIALGHTGQTVQAVASGQGSTAQTYFFATLERDPQQMTATNFYIGEITAELMPTVQERYGITLPLLPNAVAVSPDGRFTAVSAGPMSITEASTNLNPRMVWLWNTATGAQLAAIPMDNGAAEMVFSADGSRLAVAQPGQGVALLSTETFSVVEQISALPALSGEVALAFSPDGTTLAVGTDAGTVELVKVGTGQPPVSIQAYSGLPVQALAFNADGTVLATGALTATQGGIFLWDAATGAQLATLVGHNETLAGLAFRNAGAELVAVGPQLWSAWGLP